MAGESGWEWIHVYVWLGSFAVHLKLSHCYLDRVQCKIKKSSFSKALGSISHLELETLSHTAPWLILISSKGPAMCISNDIFLHYVPSAWNFFLVYLNNSYSFKIASVASLLSPLLPCDFSLFSHLGHLFSAISCFRHYFSQVKQKTRHKRKVHPFLLIFKSLRPSGKERP